MYKLIFKGNPVSTNKSYKRGRGKGFYLADDVVVYGESIGWEAKKQWKQEMLTGILEIWIIYFMKDYRQDHLNCNKKLLDSLQKIVYKNDNKIRCSHHYHFVDKENPRIELYIKEVEDIIDSYKDQPFHTT